MSSATDPREARNIVRAYSFEVEERLPSDSNAQPLAHILASYQGSRPKASDPWRRFFEPPDTDELATADNAITRVLSVETKQLREKWAAFVDSTPVSDRLNFQTSEPTMKGVIETVQEIQQTWDLKRKSGRLTKAKRFFHRFCSTLQSHKLLLEVLPSGNEYVSIFTGTLNVVIQASSNHEKLTEGLSEALCTMSRHVNNCKTDLEMFNMEDMQSLIAELYAHIFILLTSVMDWMMKKRVKRLLDSFNDDLPSVFESEMGKIREISDQVRNLAAQKSRAELRSARLTSETSARDIRLGLEGEQRHQAEMKHYAQSILREQNRISALWSAEKEQQLADNIVNMLEERAVRWLESSRIFSNARQPLEPVTFPSLGSSTAYVSEYTAEDISMNSRHLEDYFHRDRLRISEDVFDPVMVQPELFRQITDWVKARPPKLLWFEGPSLEADEIDNPLTMIAATVIELAEQTKLPIISYFCELRRGEKLRSGNNTKEIQAMISVTYALIRQLVELLPPLLETGTDLTKNGFQCLDGSVETWGSALCVLEELGRLIPGPVLCAIDGLHWLNDRSTDKYLSEFLKLLHGDKWKVLLFSTGRSVVLRDDLTTSETFAVDVRRGFKDGVALGRQDFESN